MIIKVVCLNVWNGGLRWESLVEFCQHQAADIYLLQEVFHNPGAEYQNLPPRYRTYTELQARLDLPFGQFAPAFIEQLPGSAVPTVQAVVQGNAILSKFPLQPVSIRHYDVPFSCRINERWAFPLTPRNLQHVVAQCPASAAGAPPIELHLLNTQGIWGTDGHDSPRRFQMGQDILAEVGQTRPVILGGDLNLLPQTQMVANLEQKLTNVFKQELTTSFNLRHKNLVTDPGYATAVVDMLFVSPDLKVVSHQCPQVDVSDHLPLVMEVEV